MSSLHETRTQREKRLGRSQRYVHAGVDPLIFQQHRSHTSRKNPAPGSFRKPAGKKLKPVTGGRWGVRKLACDTPNGWQWEAYCKGTMKGASGRFPTMELAVAHAQRMAITARLVSK